MKTKFLCFTIVFSSFTFAQMNGINDEKNQVLIVDKNIHENDYTVQNESNIASCAQLQIDSSNKGLLIPRVQNHTTLTNFSDGNNKEGMIVYNTTDNKFYLYRGSWTPLH